MHKLLGGFVMMLMTSGMLAQEFDKAKMDKLFSIVDTGEQSMGSFSIFQDGVEVYANTIGFIDLKSRKAANANTVYRIGSISKTYTASIIMKLIEDKKLKLNTPLSRFFPKIKNASRITIEQMLRHRSGIYNFTNTDEYLLMMEKPIGREELVEKITEFGSIFEPDQDFEYSNSNYVLLSIIAEKITKQSFAELIDEMIVKPLGLKLSYFGGKINTANNEAQSFKKIKNWSSTTETDMSIPLGAGSIASTAFDVNTFLTALFQDKVVSSDSRNKMIKIMDGFGLGLISIPFGNKKAYGHNGGIDGFQSMAYYFPKENVTVTYLANGIVYSINDLMIDALSIYFGIDKKLPEFLPAMKLSSNELDKYLGIYSSPDLPISLTVTKEGAQLIGQGTGQEAFPLDAFDVHKFKFDPANLKIEFFPKMGKAVMNQGGMEFELQSEK